MLSTTASDQFLTRNLDRSLQSVAADPFVARECVYDGPDIGAVKAVDALRCDGGLYGAARRAVNLDDMIYAKAFMRKVLTEGTDEPRSFANTLSDPRFKELAETFNFVRYGETTTAFDRTQSGTVDRYIRQTLEVSAGEDNQGVRLALYFERKAGSLESALDILGDRAMLQVAQTALGLPVTMSTLDLDKQVDMINKRLDIEDLKDPDKLARFIDRFTTLWELERPSQAPTVPNVLASRPAVYGIGPDLLLNLQNIFRGGR